MSEYIAKASIEPRDYRVVFLIQKTSSDTLRGRYNHRGSTSLHSHLAMTASPGTLSPDIPSQITAAAGNAYWSIRSALYSKRNSVTLSVSHSTFRDSLSHSMLPTTSFLRIFKADL